MSDPVARSGAPRWRSSSGGCFPKGYARESFAGKKAHALDAARLEELGEFIERAQSAARRSGCVPRHRAGRQGRLRRRLRRARARQAREGGRGHALHHRLEHQGHDDHAAGRLVDQKRIDLGDAGHEPAAAVQARRPDTTRQVQVQAPDLRVHGSAAPGLRVAARVRQGDARQRARDARDDAADEQVRRDVPVLEPPRGGGWLRGRHT